MFSSGKADKDRRRCLFLNVFFYAYGHSSFSQGFCCSFNAHSKSFKSKASNENKREDSDYEEFINTEEFDDWDELEAEVEEMGEKEEEMADKPFTEMMRSGGLVSRFPFYPSPRVQVLEALRHVCGIKFFHLIRHDQLIISSLLLVVKI